MRLAALCVFFLSALTVLPAKYAVVVGISDYENQTHLHLDGPAQDAESVTQLLVNQFDIPAGNIKVLVNAKATRRGILDAVKSVRDRVQPGDTVFIYFSGHGVSAFARGASAELCSQADTGCLIPYDVADGPPAKVIPSLVIGRNDLRPHFEAIDAAQPASFFVVFDSCYSENAAKSIANRAGTAKEVNLAQLAAKGKGPDDEADAAFTRLQPQTQRQDDLHPYARMVYLSASAKDEKAFDIPATLIAVKQAHTLDNKPHGRFTNQLLTAFRNGHGDLNRDGRISYRELHQFTTETLHGLQTPQLRMPAGSAQADSPVLGLKSLPNSEAYQRPHDKVWVKLEPSAMALQSEISKLADVEVKSEVPDFVVARADGKWILYTGAGLQLRSYEANEKHDLIQRLKSEPQVRRLFDLNVAAAKTQPTLRLFRNDKTHFSVGEHIQFDLHAPAKTHFLLLNLDTAGVVTVVYPGGDEGIGEQTDRTIPADISGGSTGAEYMKLFTFAVKPERYETWAGQMLQPGDPLLDTILAIAKSSADGDASLTLYSVPKN